MSITLNRVYTSKILGLISAVFIAGAIFIM